MVILPKNSIQKMQTQRNDGAAHFPNWETMSSVLCLRAKHVKEVTTEIARADSSGDFLSLEFFFESVEEN